MRSRSLTVYAKQSPLKAPETQSTTITSAPKPAAKLTQTDVSKLFEDFGPLCESKCFKDSFSGDFSQCSSGPCNNNESTASNSLNILRSRGSSDHSCEDVLEDDVKSSRVARVMVIGSQRVDRLQLVNSLCPAEGAPTPVQQKFDLVTRKVEKEAVTEKYHFWIKEAGTSERKHAALYNVYYKTCSVFFLVYNEDDKATFECLEHEIQLIKEANKGKEVLLVLCANKGADNKCQVSQEEVKELKEKYEIKMALESNLVSEDVESLREKLSCLAK